MTPPLTTNGTHCNRSRVVRERCAFVADLLVVPENVEVDRRLTDGPIPEVSTVGLSADEEHVMSSRGETRPVRRSTATQSKPWRVGGCCAWAVWQPRRARNEGPPNSVL